MRIKKITVKQQAYNIIKNDILSGKYKLGEKINIDSLSRQLGISNSPIREALNSLEKEGLVTNTPNAGTRVIELSEEYMIEINESVYALLSGGFDLCIANNTTDLLLEQMEKALQVQNKVLESKKYHDFVEASINFDRCFLTATKNKRLVSIYDSLYGVFFLAVIHEHENRNLNRQKNINEHIEIMSAIKNSSPEDVKKLIYKHLDKHYW